MDDEVKKFAQTPVSITKLLAQIEPPELRAIVKEAYINVEPKVIEAEKGILDKMPKTMSKGDRIAISNMVRLEAFKNTAEKVLEIIQTEQKLREGKKNEEV